jgi:hypothetical protein
MNQHVFGTSFRGFGAPLPPPMTTAASGPSQDVPVVGTASSSAAYQSQWSGQTKIGLSAVLGALIGSLVGGKKHRVLGAGAGLVLGAVGGYALVLKGVH